ncbi:SEMA4F isoform 7 [Pan troglodytes]|uniref:SEMA4F isoform 7 n=1 Tax=Pan troglodytes TaxID=9598 RepID=A0A2J8KV68_PANTR|nr:SEMA4F isoform 7 [Pan troglodytes]
MPASAARPLPGPGQLTASPFPLLLLAVLSGPVSGRVPRSVPRTSLPISVFRRKNRGGGYDPLKRCGRS